MLSLPAHVVLESYVRNWIDPQQFGARPQTEAYLDQRSCPSLTIYSAGHDDCAAWATAHARTELDETLYLPLGHWPHQEVPGLFNTLIENWTTRLSKATSARV
jgi:pimeloyl-ACP methyl ester carboxylesterase